MINQYYMLIYVRASTVLMALLPIGCDQSGSHVEPTRKSNASSIMLTVSIQPLKVILNEVGGDRVEVRCLIPPGASPHGWKPRPSDMKNLSQSLALFHVDDHFDGWVSGLPVPQKIPLLSELPAELLIESGRGYPADPRMSSQHQSSHDHVSPVVNPHFWTDPIAVIASAQIMSKHCAALDPEGSSFYQRQCVDFILRLKNLHRINLEKLAPYQGLSILQFHPSFDYLLNRYGLSSAGSIEPSPGQEPTPWELHHIIGIIKNGNVRGLIHEPQMDRKLVKSLAETFGLEIYQLDPLISQPPGASYEDWISANIETLVGIFKDS